MNKCAILFAIALFLTTTLQSQSPGIRQKEDSSAKTISANLDEYMAVLAKAYKFSGSVLVARKGEILLEKGYGWKDMATRQPNDENGIFQIGSLTKPFTAELILKLQEQGKMSVHDKLSAYFPDYPGGDDITIENLLTHTSGIPNISADETDTIAWQPVSKDFMVNHFKDQPLEFSPGSKFSYSNSGYFLLGLIIEKVTGRPYEQVMKETIFDPLQMTHSGFDFIHLNDTQKETGYAVYNRDTQRPTHLLDSTVAYAAGAMYSTARDLYTWSRSIANNKILSPGSWRAAFTPFKSTYGYGWFIDSLNGKSYVGHGGGIMGFTSYFIYFPNEDVTIILLSNVFDEKDNVDLPVQDISAIVFNKPYKLYKEAREVTLDDSILNRYVGTYALSTAPTRMIVVTKENNFLQAVLSGKTVMKIIFQTNTKFHLANVADADGEFILEKDKVIKMNITQNGIFQWNKIK